MEILSGEINCENDDQILLDEFPIGKTSINERRKLGIETIPEERTFHATVPNLTLSENTFLTYFFKYNTKSWITNLLNNPQNSLDESKNIVKNNDVRCPETNPLAGQLSGGNLQKFILGRSLANNGKAVILISQDLEEIFQLSDKICVINEGVLSEIFDVREITAADVGLLMGGQSKINQKMETL